MALELGLREGRQVVSEIFNFTLQEDAMTNYRLIGNAESKDGIWLVNENSQKKFPISNQAWASEISRLEPGSISLVEAKMYASAKSPDIPMTMRAQRIDDIPMTMRAQRIDDIPMTMRAQRIDDIPMTMRAQN
jgi:hypothetical protein